MKTARLERFNIEKDRLFFETNVMGRIFATSVWYNNVNFEELEAVIGRAELEKIVAHIAAYELNKYGSLHLDEVDLGELTKYVDDDFAILWEDIFLHVWGQWRYENSLPHDKPPRLVKGQNKSTKTIRIPNPSGKTLTFFGGGKDSFVSTSLLQKAGIPFDILEYSSSIYGNRAEQSDVAELAHTNSPLSEINELAVYDDFLDSPIVQYDGDEYHVHSLAAAETPASVFECIPIALQRGYTSLALGHELSANFPNLLWQAEDNKPINHQWGKSLEAQKKIANYVKTHLITDLHYYSTLMPLSDPAIFSLFSKLPWEQITKAHSCNITKPWCRRCAKCVYVWLFYLAFFDIDKVTDEIFSGEMLFDIEDNQDTLRMLAGYENQTPFECVGQPPETRVALMICKLKGLNQPIIQELTSKFKHEELMTTIDTQLRIDKVFLEQCELPKELERSFNESLVKIIDEKRSELINLLNTDR